MSKIEKIEIECEKVTMNPPVTLLVDRDKGKVVDILYCKGIQFRQQRLADTLPYSKRDNSCFYNSHGYGKYDCLFRDLPLKELEKYLKIPEHGPLCCLPDSLERCCNCGDLTSWGIFAEQKEIEAIEKLELTVATVFGLGGSLASHFLCGNCNAKRVNEISQINKKYGLFLKNDKK